MRVFRFTAPALLFLAACATRAEPVQDPTARGVAPALAVERFLQAANRQDLATMGRLFGTVDGPIQDRDPRAEVEQRMFAFAMLLKHDDYRIEGERIVPGRPEATQLMVRMRFGQRQVPVAYTVVRAKSGAWLVEAFDLEAITARR